MYYYYRHLIKKLFVGDNKMFAFTWLCAFAEWMFAFAEWMFAFSIWLRLALCGIPFFLWICLFLNFLMLGRANGLTDMVYIILQCTIIRKRAWRSGRASESKLDNLSSRPDDVAFETIQFCRRSSTFVKVCRKSSIFIGKFSAGRKLFSTPVWIGPASPDAGVELLRQLFLQCSRYQWNHIRTKVPAWYWVAGEERGKMATTSCKVHYQISRSYVPPFQHPPTQWNLRGGRWSSVE